MCRCIAGKEQLCKLLRAAPRGRAPWNLGASQRPGEGPLAGQWLVVGRQRPNRELDLKRYVPADAFARRC